MWMCSCSMFETAYLDILKSDSHVMYTILFVFERASRGYLKRLNRSSVEEVMAVLPRLRSAVT